LFVINVDNTDLHSRQIKEHTTLIITVHNSLKSGIVH